MIKESFAENDIKAVVAEVQGGYILLDVKSVLYSQITRMALRPLRLRFVDIDADNKPALNARRQIIGDGSGAAAAIQNARLVAQVRKQKSRVRHATTLLHEADARFRISGGIMRSALIDVFTALIRHLLVSLVGMVNVDNSLALRLRRVNPEGGTCDSRVALIEPRLQNQHSCLTFDLLRNYLPESSFLMLV